MDCTYATLLKYTNETQKIATKALQQFDKNAIFRVIDSFDLGIPYDVDRLAGGFPTGVYVQWECKEPIIPVDTTVNCCTASIFQLGKNDKVDIEKFIENLKQLELTWRESSYVMNFDRGNHFITLCSDDTSGMMYLVMHSSEKEFTKCYNGLYPVKGNWYYDDIKVFECEKRYFRYIKGKDAVIFGKTARSLNIYNEIRHENIAYSLLHKIGVDWNSVAHYHHYGMDDCNTIKVGCYTVDRGSIFPIFSKPSYYIDLFKVEECLKVTPDNKLVVPHGWGKKFNSHFDVKCDYTSKKLTLGKYTFDILKGDTFYKCPNVEYRDYEENTTNTFYECHKKQLQGEVVKRLKQIACLSASGIRKYF